MENGMWKRSICILVGIWALGIGRSSATSLDSILIQVKSWRTQILQAPSQDERLRLNDSLRLSIQAFLDTPGSFKATTDSIPFFGDLFAPNMAFRMLTWNVPLEDEAYRYFCFVQQSSGQWVELEDTKPTDRRTEFKTLRASEWYGALYYQIVPFEHKRQTHYILLGWDGYSKLSTRKVMDVMYFDNRGEPRFGKTVFKEGKRIKRRIILEFTEDAFVSVRYLPERRMIVFNHLEPMRPELEGVYEFYAPDLTFDGYLLKRGEWILQEDVDVTSRKSGKPYNDPRRRKEKEALPDDATR